MSDTYEFKPFTNSSDLDFEFQYDGKQYLVKAGQTKIFAAFLVEHAAKHFIDREIIRKFNLPRIKAGLPLNDKKTREDIYNKCVSDPASLADRITKMTQGKDPEPEPTPEPTSEPVAAVAVKAKAGRPKKEPATV